LFHLSHQPNTVGVITIDIVDSILKFSVKKYSLSLHLVEMDTDPDPDRQALDAEPDPAINSFTVPHHLTWVKTFYLPI
jgi:hypothetical protein